MSTSSLIALKTKENSFFVIMGEDYATLSITNTKEGLSLSMNECKKARKEGKEIMLENIKLPENEVKLQYLHFF